MKRPRLKKILFWGGISLAVLLLLLAGTAYFLAGTQSGTRFLFARLGTLIPGSLAVGELRGPLRGPLDLRGVKYENDTLRVEIDRLQLRWRPEALWSRQLDVERLWADGVRVVTLPTEEKKEKTPLPDLNLRFNVVVRDARVRGMTLSSAEPEPGSQPLVIDTIDLATTAMGPKVRVDRLTVRSAQLDADVQGTLQPQGAYPVDLSLRWAFRSPGLAPFSGSGKLSGTLEKLHVTQTLGSPFPASADVMLSEPLYELGFDGKVRFAGVNPRLFKPDLPDIPARGEVTLRGTLEELAGSGRVEAVVEELGPVAAVFQVARTASEDGSEQEIRVERADVTLSGTPTKASARGTVEIEDEKIRFNGDVSWANVTWPLRNPRPAELVVASRQGKAHVEGSPESYKAQVEADVAGLAGGKIQPGRWEIAGAGDLDSFRFDRLAGRLLGGSLAGRGEVAWKPQVKWNATVQATGVDPGQVVPQLAGRLNVNARSQGTVTDAGPVGRVDVQQLSGTLLGARVAGQGELLLQPQLQWKAAVRAAGIDPGRFAKDYPGKLDLVARSQGTLTDGGPVGRVTVSQLSGTLRGQPLSAQADVKLAAGQRYEVSRLEATWSDAKLSASGAVGGATHVTGDLAWNLDVPNLAIVLPQAGGAVTAEGRVSGPLKAPRIRATASGKGFRFATQSVGTAEVEADVDLAPAGKIVLDVEANALQSGEQRVDKLTLQGRGTRASHTLTLAASNAEGRLDLGLRGGLEGTTAWRGEIQRLDVRSQPIGDWSLQGAAPLAASAEAVELKNFCWTQSDGGKLCATGAWAKSGPWNADARLSSLPLRLFKAWLPPDLEVTGDLDGHAVARGNGADLLAADVDLVPGPGEIRFPGAEGRTVSFRYEQGLVQAKLGAGGQGDATARLVLVGAGSLSARAAIPRLIGGGAPLSAQPLSGRVDVDLTDLGFLAGFVPDVKQPAGTLKAGYTLGGTVGQPLLTGEARLANGRFKIPRFGLDLRDVRIAAIGDGGGSLALDGSVRSGSGTLTLKGRAGLVPSAQDPVELAFQGRNVQAVNTEEMKIQVSPDLKVAYAGEVVRVTGDVNIPQARINIEDRRKKGPVKASEDVVFVNSTGEEPDARKDLAIATRVRLILGRDVEINVFNLKGKPTGSLLLVDEPGRVTRGTGELVLNEGTFKAYGQDLKIERGRIVFAGPVDNPGIDIRAARTADDGTVAGIEAKGTVQKPEVTLWSRPAMTESEALAYLLLGRPLNQTQPQEGDRLANAATSLGLKGGNLLAKKLAARYGLEEARLESTGSLEDTSLVVGKYLSPRLYVSYGIGLFKAVNTFRIRYLINRKWTLQAETGEGTSADILYTLERQ